MTMNPLIMAFMQAMQAQQPTVRGNRTAAPSKHAALARAMAGRDSKATQAKNASLAALKPYAESDFADRFGPAGGQRDLGAFQSDAFENDAFQVSGVT
jgi:hypothetical protein